VFLSERRFVVRAVTTRLAAGTLVVLLAAGCTSAGAPTWTYAPAASPAAGVSPATDAGAAMHMAMSSAQPAQQAAATAIDIEAFDLGFKPASVSVAAAGQYDVSFHNTGSALHDLTFADGTKLTANPGETVKGAVTVPATGLAFLCSVPGHADAGMKGSVSVAGATASAQPATTTGGAAAAPVADPNAPHHVRFDPTAPAVMKGTVHDVDLPIVDKDITVAEGFVVHAWTFGGQVPGPTIRVHLGDTVRVHLTNQTQMSHSIDFHASQTAMNHQMVEIAPGATFTYTFTADYAGVWMYHCGTAPALHHIANGMFGMVIVEPKGGLSKVDEEVALVQSEWYLAGQKEPVSLAKAAAANPAPDFVVFNGVANQYKDVPIEVATKSRVRVFVLDAGPSVDSSFHVVGTIFDTVIKEGVVLAKGNAAGCPAEMQPAGAAKQSTWRRPRARSSSSARRKTACTHW
jgi:nitrite reductase (NO-forming)